MKAGNPFKSIQTILASIGRSEIKPVYLFTGEEDYFVYHAYRQTLAAFQQLRPDSSVTVRDGETCQPKEIFRILRTPSLFHPFQIVAVRDVNWFESAKTADIESVRDWIAEDPGAGVLILTAGSVNQRLGVVQTLKKTAVFLDFPKSKNFKQYEPESDDYFPAVREKLQMRGQVIEPGAWRVLRQKTPDSLWAVINAADVVSAFTGDSPRIAIADVNRVLTDHSEMPGYAVTQAFGDRDPVAFRDAIAKTMNEGLPALMLSKSLSNRIHAFMTFVSLGIHKMRLPPNYIIFRDETLPQIVERFGEHPVAGPLITKANPYALYQQLLQSRAFTITELTGCLTRLALADRLLKSGTGQTQGVLERVIVPLLGSRGSHP